MPSEVILLISFRRDDRITGFESFSLAEHGSDILNRQITCVNASLGIQCNNLDGLAFEGRTIRNTILEDVRFLIERKLNLCSTLDR